MFVGGVRLGVWGVFLSCACVSVSGVLFSVGVRVCDLFIFIPEVLSTWWPRLHTWLLRDAGFAAPYEQALVCLSSREIVYASRGRTFHCKMANNRFFL